MIKALSVIANDDYSIQVILEDGKALRLELSSIKNATGPVVEPLKQLTEFKKVFIRNGIVTWPSGYDIDPYFLLEAGTVSHQSA